MHHHPAKGTSRAYHQSGFTLIEILVVMIIMGMVSTVLFQALERAYRLQERFGAQLFTVQQGQMATDWYRQAVQGLRSDYPNGKSIFKGTSTEFSGLTDNSLGEDIGIPTLVSWKIKKDTQAGTVALVYTDGQRETRVLNWNGSDAQFIYVDAQQSQHDSWPPPLGLWPQLPQHIQLVTSDKGDAVVIIARPMNNAPPVMRPQDL